MMERLVAIHGWSFWWPNPGKRPRITDRGGTNYERRENMFGFRVVRSS